MASELANLNTERAPPGGTRILGFCGASLNSTLRSNLARSIWMARRLRPSCLRSTRQEQWKLPLPEFIEECYEKSFGRSRPERIRSLEESAKADEKRRQEKQKQKAETPVIPADLAEQCVSVDTPASAPLEQGASPKSPTTGSPWATKSTRNCARAMKNLKPN